MKLCITNSSHAPNLYVGCGRHSMTIAGLERTLGMAYLTQQKTIIDNLMTKEFNWTE